MKRFIFAALLLITIGLTLSACSHAEDRRWVSDRRFAQVWEYYEQTGDRDETVAVVRAQEWRSAEINESIYRLDQLIRANQIHAEVVVPDFGPPQIQSTATEFRLN